MTINSRTSKPTRILRQLLVIGVVAFFTGCINAAQHVDRDMPEVRAATWDGTKLFPRYDCPSAPLRTNDDTGPEAIPPVVASSIIATAPILVSKAPEFVAEQLKAIADSYSSVDSAQTTGRFFTTSSGKAVQEVGCLVWVRGRYGEATEQIKTDRVWTKERLKDFGLTALPDSYMELALIYDGNASTLRAAPRYVYYRASGAPRTNGVKTLILSVDFELPIDENETSPQHSEAVAQHALPALIIDFGRLSVGTQLIGQSLSGLGSKLIKIPRPSQMEIKGVGGVDLKLIDLVPFSVKATLVETENAPAFYLALSDLLSAGKEPLSAWAKNALETALSNKSKEK